MESPRGWPAPWIAAALLLSVPFFFFQPFAASTGGMEDTLLRGDHLVARKLPALTPRDGEIWVFHYPDDPKQIFIKRILGVAGDRIHIASGVVYRNGQRLDEPYAVHRFDNVHMYGWDLPVDSSQVPKSPYVSRGKAMLEHNVSGGSIVVPRGKYFVLGDNRENSLDSRHFGFVDQSELIGKALFIYDSTGPDKRERRNRIFKGL